MKYILKLAILTFSCIFFITKSWSAPAPYSHYVYVSSGPSSLNPIITRYQLDRHENLTNPISKKMSNESHPVLGIALAPGYNHIYYASGSLIYKCAINNDGTLSEDCNSTALPKLNKADESAQPNYLAVSTRYNKLYITDHQHPYIYSCKINIDNNDNLSGCSVYIKINTGAPPQGITVADDDRTVFFNSSVAFSANYIFACKIDTKATRFTHCEASIKRIQDHQFLAGMTYTSGMIHEKSMLTVANTGVGYLGSQCEYKGEQQLAPCKMLNQQFGSQFGGRAFDVKLDPISYSYLYFTSENAVYKVETGTHNAPKIMPETQGIPSFAIAVMR